MDRDIVEKVEKITFCGLPVGKHVYLPKSIKTYILGIKVKKEKIRKDKVIQESKTADRKTADRIIKINYSTSKLLYQLNKIPLRKNEKIRIHFLYIADSYWPSWESLYKACLNDKNIEVKLIFLNPVGTKLSSSQFDEKAEQFLKDNNIDYISYEDYFPEDEKPHILFYQTPYDPKYSVFRKVRPDFITEQGIRIAYLSYGIEYDRSVNNNKIQDLHYNHLVHKLAWKLFVMHRDIKDGFYNNCRTGGYHVVVSGHPKFDCYINQKFTLSNEIIKKANGRKIIAIQLHSYNDSDCPNAKHVHSVPFAEHKKILELLKSYKDYFFIYTIHPAYKSRNVEKKFCSLSDYYDFISEIQNAENMYLYEGNHQALLANADAFITENSSLMIEMGFFNKSVFYLYDVPVAKKAFAEKLADTFHHGHTYKDVLHFMEHIVFKEDELLVLRERYREDIFPPKIYDGKIGYRIKEYMCQKLREEQ